MKDAIEYKVVGECKLIHSIALKKWNLLCRVVKFNDKYRLIEYTPKGKYKVKVDISKEDGEWLIETLNLRGIKSEITTSITYLSI